MKSKTKYIILIGVLIFIGCNPIKERKYAKLHDRYRTLWYRTGKQCFYDSCRKYGLLENKEMGISEPNINNVDTMTLNDPTPICNP